MNAYIDSSTTVSVLVVGAFESIYLLTMGEKVGACHHVISGRRRQLCTAHSDRSWRVEQATEALTHAHRPAQGTSTFTHEEGGPDCLHFCPR